MDGFLHEIFIFFERSKAHLGLAALFFGMSLLHGYDVLNTTDYATVSQH